MPFLRNVRDPNNGSAQQKLEDTYEPPEQAFEVTDSNGSKVPVYYCYHPFFLWENGIAIGPTIGLLTYQDSDNFTFDYDEDPQYRFKIKAMPTWDEAHHMSLSGWERSVQHLEIRRKALQKALDDGLVRIKGKKLIIVGGE